MHDHGRHLVGMFFGWLHHLSRSSRRKIVRLHRLDCRRLFPDTGFARFTCLCDIASGGFDAYPGFSPPMGSTQADRTLDDSDLAVRLDHRGVCVFDALQMVPSRAVAVALWATQRARAKTLAPRFPQGSGYRCGHAKPCAWQLFDV
jgi:hypothetical protein